jgi:hypothetical protein
MNKEKMIIDHILDHHYFGNGLYGMIEDEKLIINFSPEEVFNYLFTGLDKIIQIKNESDFESFLEIFNILPEDVRNFLVKYIFSLKYFHKKLKPEIFKNLIEKVHSEYKILCDKYGVYS